MDGSVSLVLIATDDVSHLHETLSSVAMQTHAVAEVILVLGADPTRPPDGRGLSLTTVVADADGVASALNAGLQEAQNDHVLFVASGDRLTPIAIAAALKRAKQQPDAGFVHGAHRFVSHYGVALGPRRHAELGRDAYAGLLGGRVIDVHATVLYRTDLLRRVGGFREEFQSCPDYDAQLRLARAHPVAEYLTETALSRDEDRTAKELRVRLEHLQRVHRAHRPDARDPEVWQEAWRRGVQALRDRFAQEVLTAAKSAGNLRIRSVLTAAQLSPRFVLGEGAARALRRGAEALPGPVGDAVARRRPDLRALRRGRVRLGDLERTEPISRDFGFDRGVPVDRYYIESFLDRVRHDISGRVLEVGEAAYSRRFGGSRVVQQDIVHVHAGNPAATIIGDISQPGTLPPSTFDCIVLTQTLHLIYELQAAVRELFSALKPGGVLLLTVPGISQIDRGEWGEQWYWALTPAAVRRLLGEVFGEEAVSITSHGNAYSATTFLQGLALDEVDQRKLDVVDEAYPVIVTAHATRWTQERRPTSAQ